MALAAAAAVALVAGATTIAPAGAADPVLAATVRPDAAQDSITPAMIALGDSVFRGKVGGGLCMACHGLNAKGSPGLGPDLTDDRWLHGDGSLAFLRTIIRSGVAKPKEAGAPMPPFGGAPLNDRQLNAVAAYVHSLSRPRR